MISIVMGCFFWVVISLVIEGAIAEKVLDQFIILEPADFYGNTKLNWFGSYLCFILIFILSPFGTLLRLIFYLCFAF